MGLRVRWCAHHSRDRTGKVLGGLSESSPVDEAAGFGWRRTRAAWASSLAEQPRQGSTCGLENTILDCGDLMFPGMGIETAVETWEAIQQTCRALFCQDLIPFPRTVTWGTVKSFILMLVYFRLLLSYAMQCCIMFNIHYTIQCHAILRRYKALYSALNNTAQNPAPHYLCDGFCTFQDTISQQLKLYQAQLPPSSFSPGKVTKYCDEWGNWVQSPSINNGWSNCHPMSKSKLKVIGDWLRLCIEQGVLRPETDAPVVGLFVCLFAYLILAFHNACPRAVSLICEFANPGQSYPNLDSIKKCLGLHY